MNYAICFSPDALPGHPEILERVRPEYINSDTFLDLYLASLAPLGIARTMLGGAQGYIELWDHEDRPHADNSTCIARIACPKGR